MNSIKSYCYPGNQVIEFDEEGRTELFREFSPVAYSSPNIWRPDSIASEKKTVEVMLPKRLVIDPEGRCK